MKKFEELTLKELKEFYEKHINNFMKEVEKDSPNTRWRAEIYEKYYFINDIGKMAFAADTRTRSDNYRYEIGNYFQTSEEAEEYNKKLIMQQQYRDWCKFNIDWNDNNQEKYYCRYHRLEDYLDYDCQWSVKRQGVVYAESEECIKDFIDKVGEVNFKKYILEVEE